MAKEIQMIIDELSKDSLDIFDYYTAAAYSVVGRTSGPYSAVEMSANVAEMMVKEKIKRYDTRLEMVINLANQEVAP